MIWQSIYLFSMLQVDFKAKPYFPFKKTSETAPIYQKSFTGSLVSSKTSTYVPIVIIRNSTIIELSSVSENEVKWECVGEGESLNVHSTGLNAISYATNGVGKYVITAKQGRVTVDVSVILVEAKITWNGVQFGNHFKYVYFNSVIYYLIISNLYI